MVCNVIEDRMAWASTDENNLIAYLFDQQDYNTLIRPVRNRSETLDVYFEMALIQLITLVRHTQPMNCVLFDNGERCSEAEEFCICNRL